MKRISQSVLVVVLMSLLCQNVVAQDESIAGKSSVANGLSINEPEASAGYTLIFPMRSAVTYLVDNESRVVNQWKSRFTPAHSAHLMPNGDLIRASAESGFGPGAGGSVQRFNWDGDLVWDFSITSVGRDLQPHHDICPMPNGNVLLIAYAIKSAEEAEAAGRPTDGRPLQADCILEIKPTGQKSGEIVWEWHAWDHLIQDVNKNRPRFGEVSEHPELIDVNFGNNAFEKMMQDPKALARLRSLGYVGGGTPQPPNDTGDDQAADDNAADENVEQRPRGGSGPRGDSDRPTDWLHMNAVDYHPQLDQIVLSVHGFSEFWIIDHSTSTKEAASHAGGRSGKGGDLLYRWGNPQAYRNGSNVDRRLYQQHSVHWIPEGLPGAGNILLFNNGSGKPDGNYSSVDEIDVPVTEDGRYERDEYVAFGPTEPTWSYTAKNKESFFSHFISGTRRLPNGNTLICSGAQGIVFEVTSEGKTVWQYKHPGVDQAGGPEPAGNRNEDAADGGLRIGGPGGLFRVYRYASDYPAFEGKTLTPGEKLADLAEATD